MFLISALRYFGATVELQRAEDAAVLRHHISLQLCINSSAAIVSVFCDLSRDL